MVERLSHACYMLKSKNLGRNIPAYIGATCDPQRRLRQHNGERAGGAKRTARWRPWSMVIVVHGFPSEVAALQFEWAWQHPHRSRHFKNKRFTGARRESLILTKLEVLAELLRLDYWARWPLKLHFVDPEIHAMFGRFQAPPDHIQITAGDLASLPAVTSLQSNDGQDVDAETDCIICFNTLETDNPRAWLGCTWRRCKMRGHVLCLSEWFMEQERLAARAQRSEHLLPIGGTCPICRQSLKWGDLIQAMKQRCTHAQEDTAAVAAVPLSTPRHAQSVPQQPQQHPQQHQQQQQRQSEMRAGADDDALYHADPSSSDQEQDDIDDDLLLVIGSPHPRRTPARLANANAAMPSPGPSGALLARMAGADTHASPTAPARTTRRYAVVLSDSESDNDSVVLLRHTTQGRRDVASNGNAGGMSRTGGTGAVARLGSATTLSHQAHAAGPSMPSAVAAPTSRSRTAPTSRSRAAAAAAAAAAGPSPSRMCISPYGRPRQIIESISDFGTILDHISHGRASMDNGDEDDDDEDLLMTSAQHLRRKHHGPA
ncbi:hypothetical protein BC831DRAFT_448694 [Entophlyctis helioformis]|nr:hypothetical protein BC831DRAFT_448694 [Entophlyctis helioformis]